MDARNSRFATQFTRLFAALAFVLLLAGCDVKVINRTPATFSENPSQVYTITAEVKVRGGVVWRNPARAAGVANCGPEKPSKK